MEILSAHAGAPGLVVGILLLAGGTFAWFRIRRQVRMISKAIFGTPSLSEGLERQADVLAETPKSVSGMTRLCLPQIEEDFPEFHWPQWRQMCENMLKAYLAALSSQDMAALTGKGGAASEELRKQVEFRIQDQRIRGVRETYRQVKIHQTEIARYQKEAGMCVIKLQSAVEYYYEETGPEGEVSSTPAKISGKRSKRVEDQPKNRKIQTRYNMELIYIQDLSKIKDLATAVGVTCPNCGAPITGLGSKFCEYCGTGVTPVGTRVWKLHRVEGENH